MFAVGKHNLNTVCLKMCRHKKFYNLNLLFCLAVKAKTVEEVVKNRPAAGILDTALAVEYKVIHYLSVPRAIKIN